MKFIVPISDYFRNRQLLQYLIIFSFAFFIFSFIQADPTVTDPDAFYHIGAAQTLQEYGAITEFKWLSATDLKYSFTDHHFLYHLLLIPFINFFPPIIGLKILSITLGSLFVVAFFWFLKEINVKGAVWYALVLPTIDPFIFRLGLGKAQPLVLILLLLGLWCLFNKKYLGLLLVSFLYVWTYAGWPLFVVLSAIYVSGSLFRSKKEKFVLFVRKHRTKILKQNLKLLVAVGLGSLSGIFFNPYFPKNLWFYWQQTFKIGLVNYQKIISVGGEWYPYNPLNLVADTTWLFVFFTLSLVLFLVFKKQRTFHSKLFFIYTLIFLVLTIKSRRNVEYLIPFVLIFSALNFGVFIEILKQRFKKLSTSKIFALSPVIVVFLLSPLFYADVTNVRASYSQGILINKFQEPMEWLKNNTGQDAIVFHSDWDEFPILFYNNRHNRYIVGLDPTFLYQYDKDLHKKFVEITTGVKTQDLYPIIKDLFDAQYVFVDINQNIDFDSNLANNFYFEKVFENQEARIYKVVDNE